MAYKSIEDLPVWRAAMALAVRIFDLTSRGALGPHPGLRDQIERAVVSISNNIAEGYERGTSAELLTFLYYARGSAGEVRSMLALLAQGSEWASGRQEVEELRRMTLGVSRQLGGWMEAIKDSEAKGQRYQNSETRQQIQQRKRQEAYQAKLDQIIAKARLAANREADPSNDPVNSEGEEDR